jgi:hypothetical protein
VNPATAWKALASTGNVLVSQRLENLVPFAGVGDQTISEGSQVRPVQGEIDRIDGLVTDDPNCRFAAPRKNSFLPDRLGDFALRKAATANRMLPESLAAPVLLCSLAPRIEKPRNAKR